MPITDADTLLKQLNNFRPESDQRSEAFIVALMAALQVRLLDYFNGGDGSLRLHFTEMGITDRTNITTGEQVNRFMAIREMFSTKEFQVGEAGFRISPEQTSEANAETIKGWIILLQEKLLGHYRQAPENQRLQRLGEISLMFRSLKLRVGQQPISIAAPGAGAETNIANFKLTYGGGCPPGTVCIDGNCV